MDFTENELHELLTAVADQRTYYRINAKLMQMGPAKRLYEGKRDLNDKLYNKLQGLLLATETAEVL